MAHIPKIGTTVGEYVVESARENKTGWRPVLALADQREAIELMDATGPSSYALRVVQVVAVRLPAGAPSASERIGFAEHVRELQQLGQEYGPDRYDDDFPRPRGVTP